MKHLLFILRYDFCLFILRRLKQNIALKLLYFILHIIYFKLQDQAEATENFEEFKLATVQQGYSVQPRIHLIGTPISVAEVTIVDQKFIFIDPLEALEIVFFFFTALNIKYPAAAEQVWTLIGELIFNDKNLQLTGSARTLLHDIKKVKHE